MVIFSCKGVHSTVIISQGQVLVLQLDYGDVDRPIQTKMGILPFD